MLKRRIACGMILAAIIMVSYTWIVKSKKTDHWAKMYLGVGTNSSPRAVDLNEDGVLDLVIGAGAKEYEATENGVMAINGINGEILWKVPAINQMIGSAIFKDITSDGIQDVFIGGRSSQFFVIDGKSGEVIWNFLKIKEPIDHSDTSLLNFFNPQFISDQSGDGIEELLVSFGGFVGAGPADFDRPTGKLMVLNTMNGQVVREFLMPDRKETYMSPVIQEYDGEIFVIFGSGGETIDGHLYRIALKDLMEGNEDAAIVLADGMGKGFIAPPVLADITHDGIHDIIVSTMNGRILSIDGKTNKQIWEVSFGEIAETQAMPVPGFFNDDQIPDFFATIGLGTWPFINSSIHVLIDGENGEELFRDTLGILQFSSPVTFDINRDGHQDVIQYVNDFEEPYSSLYVNQVMVYDLVNRKTFPLSHRRPGINLGSTTLVVDIDSDQKLDLIFCYVTEEYNIQQYKHLVVERVELNKIIRKNPWGGYMGTNFQSIFN